MLTSECPACRSAATRVAGARDGHAIIGCDACGTEFFPRPIEAPTDYQDYYPYLGDFDAARRDWELAVRRRKHTFQLRMLAKLTHGRRLLDVGAGPGYFCRRATELGWTTSGVEVSQSALREGRDHHGVAYISLAAVAPGNVDAITCHHVLEHIDDPAAFLAVLRSKLAPGGVLVLQVPNNVPLSFWLRNAASRGRHLCSLYYPVHLTGFTSTGLRTLLARSGFDAVRVRDVSMWSRFYDPFFLRNYFRSPTLPGKLRGAFKATRHTVRSAVDVAGVALGRGDWLVGYFRVQP